MFVVGAALVFSLALAVSDVFNGDLPIVFTRTRRVLEFVAGAVACALLTQGFGLLSWAF